MLLKTIIYTLIPAVVLSARHGLEQWNKELLIRNDLEALSIENLPAFRRSVASALILKRDTIFKNTTTLDTSFNGAVLFNFKEQTKNSNLSGEVQIVCATCYIKGKATAQLTTNGDFNVSQALQNITSEFEHDINNIETTLEDYVKNVTSNITSEVSSGDFSFEDLDLPPIPFDLQLNIPTIPEAQLNFQFDGLELYMEIDVVLSAGATYNLPLYKSETPLGISIGKNELGIIFSVDLILSVEGEIDISSGFHIQLEDGIVLNIPMFSNNVSSITNNGGKFEFLPVTITSPGVILTALLRVGAKAGFQASTPDVDIPLLSASTGIEAEIWMNVAELTTNVTASSSAGCEMGVIEVYSMAIGANAGATVALGEDTWGPAPSTTIPLFGTTLASACAITKASSETAATSAVLKARADLTTTTISTKVTYTGTACLSTGLIDCPASLQTISKYSTTQFLTTAVPSGQEATFPPSTQDVVANTIAFGTGAKEISSSSGSPVPYTPSPTSGPVNFVDEKHHGVSDKVIIGTSVGIGLPVLIAAVAGSVFFFRSRKNVFKRREEQVFGGPEVSLASEPPVSGSRITRKAVSNAHVTEVVDSSS